MKLTFVKMGINGEGIAYDRKTPIFCAGVFPEETAEVKITENNGRFKKAELIKLLKPSKYRISSPCKYSNRCKACPLIEMQYKKQVYYKKELLEEALFKYAHVHRKLVRDIHISPSFLHYRNACKLPVREDHGKLVTGMYQPESNHFCTIPQCVIHDAGIETIRVKVLNAFNEEHFPAYQSSHGLRYLMIRGFEGHYQCCAITGKDTLSVTLIQKISLIEGLDSFSQSVNTKKKGNEFYGSTPKILYGKDTIAVVLTETLSLPLKPESFFQLNTEQAKKLYEVAVGKIDPCDTLVEAYCGNGAMSFLAKDKAKHIIGIESTPSSIASAKEIAMENHYRHISFLCMDAAKGLKKVLEKHSVNILLADPPRSGMDEAMLETILHSSIRKVIYVSCNPATLAKNTAVLKEAFDVRTVIPFDLFPNTPLVESVTVFERRGMKKNAL